MPIDIQEIISRMQSQVEKTAEEAPVAAPAVAVPAAPTAAPAPAAEPTADEQQKVAAEMDEAGRVIARAFYDELNKIAVSAHGYTPSEAEDQRANPAVQVAFAPERLENTMKAVQILEQLTAGERVHGTEGYIQVNGQPTEPTQPEIPVEEHPLAIDVDKRASAEIVSAVYQHLFGE